EVQHISGVVAVAEQHAASGGGCLGHAVDLPGRRRGEEIAAGGARGQPWSDQSGEGRVVSRTAADDYGYLVWLHFTGAHHSAIHPFQAVAVGCDQAVDGCISESGGII